MSRDIFDRLTEVMEEEAQVDAPDSYVEEVKKEIDTLSSKINKYAQEKKRQQESIKAGFKEFIRSEIEKIKPADNIIERVVEKKIIEPKVFHVEPKIIEAPPQIIKEVRVEVEKKDGKKYVEESKYLDLLVKIAKLEAQLKETRRMAESPIIVGGPGGSGVIGIPPPEPHEGKVLTVVNRKAAWAASSGGASISGYTVNNGNTLKTFDVTDTTLDEVARVLGSLLTDLQA